ncbi:MAG: uncharacterized protein JWN98_1163 [Abditibacteriota bacterium]|nr:uncharacterized protein [Abditibacteriota bacterium]
MAASYLLRLSALALLPPVIYSLIEPHLIQVHRFDVEMENLPESVHGLRIVQFSDLHISAITSPRLLRRVVEMSNHLNPDAVVLTGDFISRRGSYSHLTGARIWARPVMEYAHDMAEELKALRAPDGIFGVPGNHDHSRGRFEAIGKLLQGAGVATLVNQSTLIRDVLPVVGLDDLRAGRPDLPRAFAGIEQDDAQVVLSHNPRILPRLADRNCLILSGHTHAGQVHLPFTNFRRRPQDMHGSDLFQGWYAGGRAKLYVSSGVGSVHFPMRFRCPPEITVFTLRYGETSNQ